MIMNYKEVEGIDENGNPTTFKIEIPQITGLEALEKLKNRPCLSTDWSKKKINYDYNKEEYDAIEKELDEGEKAKELLKIIIEKRVDINFLYRMLLERGGLPYNTYGDDKKALKEYNECNEIKLTETEFNKIRKEVCK